MTLQRSQDIPEPIVQLQQQLDQWRGTQRKRTKLLAYDDLRIGSNEIRPLRRNRADRDIIDPEQ
jgi:hypothetical protein